MARGLRGVVLAVVATARAVAAAAPTVDVSADVAFADAVRVEVTVANTSGEPLRAVSAEIRHRLLERTVPATDLAAGARHVWRVAFPLPAGPGGDALVVLVRWQDAGGDRHSRPYARLVETPGLLPTEAQVIVEAESAAGYQQAGVRITNATGAPLRARLAAVIPEEFFTTPAAQPVDVPPRQTVRVPVNVQSHGPAGTTYPVYAIVRFEQGGIPRAIVAGTTLGIGGSPARSGLRPLAVGALFLLLAVAALLAANARAARRRAAASGLRE